MIALSASIIARAGLVLLASIQGAVAAASAAAPVAYGQRDVEIREYQIDASFVTSLGGAASLAVQIGGTLKLVRPAERGGAPAMERVDLGSLRVDAKESGVSRAGAFRGLGEPVFVERDAGGVPVRMVFAPGVDRGTRQVIEYIVAELQVARPGAAGATTWSRVERDTTGRYRADYRRERGGDVVRITKRAYEPEPGRPRIDVVQSERRIRLAPDGGLAELRSHERLRIPEVGSETTSSFSGTLLGRTRAPWPAGALSPPPGSVPFDFGRSGAITQEDRDDVALAGQTLDGVMQAVRTSSGGDLFRALGRLAAFLRRDPAALAAVEADATAGRTALPRLVSALVDSGSEASEALLARWLTGRSPERARVVSGELLLRHPPHAVLTDALARVASDRANPAWQRCAYALGTAASLLRPSDPEGARGLAARLLADEAAAPPADRPVFLAAIGNTADPDVVARLAARTGAADPAIAEAAALALGRVATAEATSLLDQTARHGAHAAARRAALLACGRREAPIACRSPRALALEDRDATVRRAALDATRPDRGPEAKALLRRMSLRDPDPELRQYAGKRLEELAAPPAARARQPEFTWQTTPAAPP
jgi:hypothetical protein